MATEIAAFLIVFTALLKAVYMYAPTHTAEDKAANRTVQRLTDAFLAAAALFLLYSFIYGDVF